MATKKTNKKTTKNAEYQCGGSKELLDGMMDEVHESVSKAILETCRKYRDEGVCPRCFTKACLIVLDTVKTDLVDAMADRYVTEVETLREVAAKAAARVKTLEKAVSNGKRK